MSDYWRIQLAWLIGLLTGAFSVLLYQWAVTL